MANESSKNKRIAQNTIFLYIRMLLTMAVTLYTSRIVLATLGVEDYGIYNVVGGVVTMFSFLNGTISGVTQRFLTFELGTGNKEKIKSVFNTAMCIHWIVAGAIVLLAETIGLWFVCNKLVIPEDRMVAAIWVYQFSILSTVVFFISIPYNACIIAHEKMSAFAYISIMEVVLKLIIVYLLLLSSYDKLIIYAILMFLVQLLIRLIYNEYCKRHFEESKYEFRIDQAIAKKMLGFTGWTLFGGFASVGMGQGLNILLNMFFGPAVNAARAVALQVDSAVQSFVANFQMALNPQIIKNYAANDLPQMRKLVYASSRYSYYLLFFLALPIVIEAPFILEVWLKDVPDYTVAFLRITMLVMLVNAVSNPLITSANATGNIKKYQMIVGTILLLIVPFAYIVLRMGCTPESVFWVYFIFACIAQVARLWMIRPMIGISIRKYALEVVARAMLVTILSLILPILSIYLLEPGWSRFGITGILCILSVLTSVYTLGISEDERTFVYDKIGALCKKLKK